VENRTKTIQRHRDIPKLITGAKPTQHLETPLHQHQTSQSPGWREDAVTTMGVLDTERSNVEEEANPPGSCANATPTDSIEGNLVVRTTGDQSPQHCQNFRAAALTSIFSATPSEPSTQPSGIAIPTYHRSHSKPQRHTTQPPATQTAQGKLLVDHGRHTNSRAAAST
jgi:hypothetical protein